eukprot:TRINITY_DN1740_c0_g1_i1.p1 TRINITY_DN1740_c0_g1~~TRINITY_DN1740_c0_g1_i1.p1  ORF type:complete len:283 (-),score=53.60 TRINITY_DN1740_c0_g1_i1:191-1039(-)
MSVQDARLTELEKRLSEHNSWIKSIDDILLGKLEDTKEESSNCTNKRKLDHKINSNNRQHTLKKMKTDNGYIRIAVSLIQKQEKITAITNLLGGILGDYKINSTTHLVCKTDKKGSVERTFKYFYALLEGIWIVGYNWIKDSEKAKTWLPEEQYEVSVDSKGILDSPKFSRLNPTLRPLLKGFMCTIDGKLRRLPHEEQLTEFKSLVRVSGMKFVPTKTKWKSEISLLNPTERNRCLVFCDSGISNSQQSGDVSDGVVRVTIDWLFDTISLVRIVPFDNYML